MTEHIVAMRRTLTLGWRPSTRGRGAVAGPSTPRLGVRISRRVNMATMVRDALVKHAKGNEGKFFTVDELAERLKVARDSAAGSVYELSRRAILTRRKRDGSTAFEYGAGKRIAFGEKYAGRKFPYHLKGRSDDLNGDAVPAAGGGVGIVVKLDGQAHAITLAQAKELFVALKVLFGH